MEKQTITIPDGCKAEIRQEKGKTVIVIDSEGKKRWRGAAYNTYFGANFEINNFKVRGILEGGYESDDSRYLSGNYFRTEDEAKAFCDDLNKAIKPIFDKAKRGEYDK